MAVLCVDSELGLCQFYWVSIFVCILRFQGYFHHKVSNPIYACDTIKQSFLTWRVQNLKQTEDQTPNAKSYCKCQYHDHYDQAQCKYKQETDPWLVRSGQHCPLIGHFTRFTKGGVRGNSQSIIWSEKSVRFVLGNLTRVLTSDVSIVKCSRLVFI